MRPKYSIIIATKNEEEAIAKVLCSIPKEITKEAEVIVADSSNDCTPIIAQRMGAKIIKVRKRGKGRAMRQGVEASSGDILIFLDGDGTDPPQYIPKLLKKLEKANLVLGCRSMKTFDADDLMTREVFRIYGLVVRPIFRIVGLGVSDPMAGFRAIRREDWNKLNLKSNGFEIETEMDIRAVENKFVVKEIAIPHIRRGGGILKSKFVSNPKNWFKVINVLIRYVNDKKVKSRLIYIRSKLKNYIKILKENFSDLLPFRF